MTSIDGLILVDGKNLAYRAHFSNKTRNGAVYGFGMGLADIMMQAACRDVIVCWDNGLPGDNTRETLWRKKLDTRYKSNRNLDDLERRKIEEQLPKIGELVRRAGYLQLGVPGCEADDLISIISWRLAKHPLWAHVYIYSADEDYYSLLRPGLTILQPNRRGGIRRVRLAELQQQGQTPFKFELAKALSGCTSDAVSGIPKCGPVSAKKAVALGADPRAPWSEQPESYRAAFPKHEAYWHEAQRSWKLVRLPRAAADIPEHASQISAALAVVPRLRSAVVSTKENIERAQRLTTWLHEEKLDMLALRRSMLVNPKTYQGVEL